MEEFAFCATDRVGCLMCLDGAAFLSQIRDGLVFVTMRQFAVAVIEKVCGRIVTEGTPTGTIRIESRYLRSAMIVSARE